MNPEAEKKLMEYILHQERADVSGSLRRIFDAFQEHEGKDEVRHTEIKGEIRGISLRVGALEKDRDKLERSVEDTGRFHVGEMIAEKKALEEKMETAKWAVLRTVGAVALLVLSTLAAFLMGKGK